MILDVITEIITEICDVVIRTGGRKESHLATGTAHELALHPLRLEQVGANYVQPSVPAHLLQMRQD